MDFTELRHLAEQIETECGKAIIGKGEQIRLVLTSLFAGGHVLIDDIPGVGKTTLVKALSAVLGCGMVRVQFTRDLLPSDIVGMNIYSQKTGEMVFTPGPIMTNILLADEINRAIPRTQSALLEAMEERQVSVDGVTYPLAPPFMVLATQNPVETENTFALPAAQLDRFLFKLSMGYPTPREEAAMLRTVGDGAAFADLRPLLSPEEIAEGVTSAVRIQTSTDGDHFETIAGPDDFYPYTLEKYISNSGDVWDLVVYQDVVYLSLMTTIGAVVYKGVEVGKGQPGANEYGWQWTEFIGDGLGKQGDPIYPAGFGNPLNYVMSPIVYKGDLYYYTLSNAFDSMVQAIFSLVKLVRNQDINAYFDGLKTMENSMKNQASIYRLTADGEMQMVMGSPDEYFNKENGNYLSETLHAFSNSTELGCMQYIWRAVEYNGKLFFGTFDASTLNHYFTFLTNGDLIGMTDESCEHLIRSAIDLINLLKKETVIDEGTTDTLVKVLGTLNSMVDKKATEATVRQLLEISLQFKKAFDKVSPLLDKLVNSDWAQAIGDKIEGINALRSIYNTLANIDTEGLERYIRISNAIMDAEQGFDLYTTEDGIHYTEILNDGLQDRYNYGSRSFIAGSDGLYVGTANPYYGGQLWKFNEITAELKSLSAEGFEIAFDPDVTTYDIAASADAEQIRLTAVGADPATKVVINGQETDGSEAVNVALQPGANVIRIETASIDGSETAVYTVNVARGEVPVTPEQTDPTAPSQPADSDGEQPAGGQTEASVPSSDQPSGQEPDADIPATGAGMSVTMLAALVLGASGTMVFSRKKRR